MSEELKDAAPRFCAVYATAAEAEHLGLAELVGIGYRKALEFLIKEWLIVTGQAKADDVGAAFLGECIKRYINDPRIKAIAERTAWLGNDETHFVRRFQDHDLGDLKQLFSITKSFIETDLRSRKYESEIQARRP